MILSDLDFTPAEQATLARCLPHLTCEQVDDVLEQAVELALVQEAHDTALVTLVAAIKRGLKIETSSNS